MQSQSLTSTATLFTAKNFTRHLPLLSFLVIAIASFYLYQPVFYWFIGKIALSNGYIHLFAITGILSLGIYRIAKLDKSIFHSPNILHPALLLWIPAIILYLLNERNIGFHTLSASLFIVYLYGLAGHFLAKKYWHAILLPLLLIILLLPFEHYLDVYLGFPLRLLSAKWAASVLHFSQATTTTVESILMVDNKAAIVDLDCSGIKSLWIGLIFYLLLTWVENYRIGLPWLIIAGLFIALLVLANVFRIVILVLLDLVFDQAQLAALFHQSLGLLGFVISSILIWTILNRFVEKKTEKEKKKKPATKLFNHNHLSIGSTLLNTGVILSLIIAGIYFYQPFVKQTAIPSKHTISLALFDKNTLIKPIALSPQESDFFVNSASLAQKYSLSIEHNHSTIKASMVLVWSKQWRAQHIPENCYISQGYSITDKGVWAIKPKQNLRYLSLNKKQLTDGKSKDLSGIYWFQSAKKSTPDYSSRIMDSLLNPNQEWVMVSILWDQPINPEIISPLVRQISSQLITQLKED